MRRTILPFLLTLLAPFWGFANGLVITNMNVDQDAQTVTFNVQWFNSWRTTTGAANWDAAWIFVKWRRCGEPNNVGWTHALLNTDLAQHSFGPDLEPVKTFISNSTGFRDSAGLGLDPEGAMLRRTAINQVFPNAGPHTVTLRFTNIPPSTDPIDIKIFGIEMVYIPAGNFSIGDNALGGGFTHRRFVNTTVDNSNPLNFTFAGTAVAGAPASISVDNLTYPRGTTAFHCMKYEITQGQYAEFLNTIAPSVQSLRYPGNYNVNRNRLSNTGTPPYIYVTDRENRAQNFLSWAHLSAYLDWACLRPMSELEYTKICRGLGPVNNNECAWGTPPVANVTQLTLTSPLENGTEYSNLPANANARYGNNAMTNADPGTGPVRVGVFALPTNTSRVAAGATYYGVMEMSGNLWEIVIPLSTVTLSTFLPTLGDGNINTTTGNHDVPDWPAATVVNPGTGNLWVGVRGGGWDVAGDALYIENRRYCVENGYVTGSSAAGGRGLR